MFQDKGLVNLDASHYAGSAFTSTVDPRTVNPNVMPSISSNIQAANASKFIGGRKTFINRKKINKISRMYKMKGSRKQRSRKVRRMKSRVRSRYSSNKRSSNNRSGRGRSRSSRSQRGGYAQGFEQTYSTGGHLSPSLSAMANPVPFQVHGNNVNNYNHFTRQ